MDVTYALEDGGGRELAYVAMSRARGESHVHVVAPRPVPAASERLAWAWGDERRQSWAIGNEATKSLAELNHQRVQLARSIPPDRSGRTREHEAPFVASRTRPPRLHQAALAVGPAHRRATPPKPLASPLSTANEHRRRSKINRSAGGASSRPGGRCGKRASASTKR